MSHQIVVVGAGIAGLATAAALQHNGHDVTVLEQRDDTSPGAGISIWPNALAALDLIGLGDAVRAGGGRITAGALEDAATLATMVAGRTDIAAAFAAFAMHRRTRTSPLVRESAMIGTIMNLRPALLSALATKASTLVPEVMLMRHLAAVASRSAFQLPG